MRSLRSINAAFFARSRALRGAPPEGVPPPFGRLPLPLQKPPRGGVIRPPEGRGRAAPLSGRRPPLRPPWGTPTGFPRLRRLPLPSGLAAKGASEARRALARRRGWKKIKVAAPIAAAGRQRWKCGEGEAVGGQGWGQPVGSPRAVHGVSLPLSTDRRSRSPVA